MTYDRVMLQSVINHIIPDTSNRSDTVQIIKILKNTEKSCQIVPKRHLVNHTRIGNSVMRQTALLIRYGNRNRTAGGNSLVHPFPGQITLHLPVYNFPLLNHRIKIRFLDNLFTLFFRRFTLRFRGLFDRRIHIRSFRILFTAAGHGKHGNCQTNK